MHAQLHSEVAVLEIEVLGIQSGKETSPRVVFAIAWLLIRTLLLVTPSISLSSRVSCYAIIYCYRRGLDSQLI